MIGAFFHSHKMRKINDKYYSTGGLSYDMLKRYLVICDELIVSTRVVKNERDESKYVVASGDKIKLQPYCEKNGTLNTVLSLKSIKNKVHDIVFKSDFVISRLPSLIGNIAIKEAIKQHKPYLIELVGCPWDAYWNHSLKGKIFAPFMTLTTKKYVRKAEYVLYVTGEFLQRRYPTKGNSISCSNVLLTEVNKDILAKKLKRISSKDNSKFIIATTAAVDVKYKGQQDVIKAIAKLKNEKFEFEYYVIGDGNNEYLSSIAKKNKIEDKIKFLGAISHDKVFEILDNVDIYIQPSKQEGLPRALLEAMSRGCFCMGANTGGIPELLDERFVFKKGSVNEIANLLKNINEKDFEEQAKLNFNKSSEYKKEILNERRTAFYKKFINKK